jgi:hypothetical protein
MAVGPIGQLCFQLAARRPACHQSGNIDLYWQINEYENDCQIRDR